MILLASLVAVAVLLLVVAVACYVASDKVAPVKLNGAKVVITGGSDGLGLILATRLAQSGSHLVIIARNQAKLNKALSVIQAAAINSVRHMGYKAHGASSNEPLPHRFFHRLLRAPTSLTLLFLPSILLFHS